MAVIATPPKLQFFAADGTPLVGGKLYSYQAGTTTPLPTYADESGVTYNTNPVVLDSRGEASVWFGNQAYKLKLTTANDEEIWTVDDLNVVGADPLTALAAATGATLVGFKQPPSTAVARTVAAKLGEIVSVKDFGAVGNGTTDDTPAFNDALAAQEGGVVLMPGESTYRLASAPTNYNTGILILGAKPSVSALPGTSDTSVYGKTSMILQRHMDAAASATPLSGNEFLAVFQCTTPTDTSSTGSYQKGPIYARMTHNEQSIYSPSFIGKDAVGVESQVILETTTNGRAWTYHGLAELPTGKDGYLVGVEIEILNRGSTEDDPQDEQLSKAGFMAVARTGIGTRAVGIWGQPGGGANGSWAHGIVFNPTSINTNGTAMIMPNGVPICTWSPGAYPTTYSNVLYSNSSNVLVLGTDSASVSVVPAVNCQSTLAAAQLVATSSATSGAAGQFKLGNSTAASAGTVATYLEVYLGATKYKIPLYANS